jgi:hypothetical protein
MRWRVLLVLETSGGGVEKTCAVYEELLSRRAARGAKNSDDQRTLSARGPDVRKLRVSRGARP